jgi:hypothetical protein
MGICSSRLQPLVFSLLVSCLVFGAIPNQGLSQQQPKVGRPARADKVEAARQPGQAGKAVATDFDPVRVEAAKSEIQGNLNVVKIKMELKETEHLLVFTDLGSEATDSVAGLAEKAFVSSCRLLKIDDTKAFFPTKFAVVVLEKDQFYDSLQRQIFQTSSTASRSVLWRTEGESPCLLISNFPSSAFRTPGFNGNWTQWTARFLGTVVLLKKFPDDATHSRLPVWIRDGFGLYASLAAQDDPDVIGTYRTQIRERMQDKVKMFDFSSGSREFYNFHVASVVEYLLSVPEPGEFEAFVSLLQKQKVVRDERVSLDLQSELGWDRELLERDWRYFAKTGKRLAR